MKRLLPVVLVVAALTAAGCSSMVGTSEMYESPFYAKYLDTGSALDAQITRTLEALRANPRSPILHNELGALLVRKGFPNDAEREFERAINADSRYYPAWYNLGLVRAARGDQSGARRAFRRTVNVKPGHAAALFQLGLVEEANQHIDRAVDLYAKAYSINPALLDVQVNPRVLDSKLTHLALLRLYPIKHTRESMQFQGTPSGYREPQPREAPSPQQPAEAIVPPAPPVTDPGTQKTPPN
jgi:tetratricopeptide (TPR) repeat protein